MLDGYKVTEVATGRTVAPGDTVTDFRGRAWAFVRVERGPESSRPAVVTVCEPESKVDSRSDRSFYDRVFGLRVSPA